MANFSDFNTAARFKEFIRSVVVEVLDEKRPRDRFGTVTALDVATRTVEVEVGGLTGSFPMKTGEIRPPVGSIVRIRGNPGAYSMGGIVSAEGGSLVVDGLSIGDAAVLSGLGDSFVQSGQETSLSPDANGELSFTYPEAFASAATTVYSVRINTTIDVTHWMKTRDATGFTIRIERGGSPYVGGGITEVNWIAHGVRA